MKLIYCPKCLDVKRLQMMTVRHCFCGKSWGYYLEDNLTGEIGGYAVPIAIENDKLREAVQQRPAGGRGFPIEARILPLEYDTVKYRSEPNPDIKLDLS